MSVIGIAIICYTVYECYSMYLNHKERMSDKTGTTPAIINPDTTKK